MDFLAGFLELVGLILVGYKLKWGFILNALGCSTWIYYVLSTGQALGLLLVVIPAIMINVINFRRWHKGENDEEI